MKLRYRRTLGQACPAPAPPPVHFYRASEGNEPRSLLRFGHELCLASGIGLSADFNLLDWTQWQAQLQRDTASRICHRRKAIITGSRVRDATLGFASEILVQRERGILVCCALTSRRRVFRRGLGGRSHRLSLDSRRQLLFL